MKLDTELASERLIPRRLTGPVFLTLVFLPVVKLIVQLLVVKGYGLHGDELYYLACSEHLDWGYVDQPPLSLFLLHLQRSVFGDSMLSLRFLPALCGAFTVGITGLLARRMGAGTFGQMLAEICILIAPVYLAENHYFSMNSFDVLFWALSVYILVLLLDGGKPYLWVWFGLCVGLGFENKVSVLFLCFGIAIGLLLTRERRILITRSTALGAAVALILMLPNIIWQAVHAWPTVEFIRNARANKMIPMSPVGYLVEQVILMQPLAVFVWVTGLLALGLHKSLAPYRSLAWCYVTLLAFFVVAGGKPYYLAPAYPPLFAAGAVFIERVTKTDRMRIALCALLLLAGLLTAPLGMPVLSPGRLAWYQKTIGLRPSSAERGAEAELPSFFASMFGWEEIAATVDSVYRSLPPEDRSVCGIFCQSYAEAGAIDFYGRRYGLPPAISGHNSYWLWGTRGYTGEVMIVVGGDVDVLRTMFGEVNLCARVSVKYAQPQFHDLPVVLVRKPKQSVVLIWPRTKEFI